MLIGPEDAGISSEDIHGRTDQNEDLYYTASSQFQSSEDSGIYPRNASTNERNVFGPDDLENVCHYLIFVYCFFSKSKSKYRAKEVRCLQQMIAPSMFAYQNEVLFRFFKRSKFRYVY